MEGHKRSHKALFEKVEKPLKKAQFQTQPVHCGGHCSSSGQTLCSLGVPAISQNIFKDFLQQTITNRKSMM
jgi:hypothetical protein